jgi:hypothetical protein
MLFSAPLVQGAQVSLSGAYCPLGQVVAQAVFWVAVHGRTVRRPSCLHTVQFAHRVSALCEHWTAVYCVPLEQLLHLAQVASVVLLQGVRVYSLPAWQELQGVHVEAPDALA